MGGATAYRVRSQLRSHWPSLLLLAVLVGAVFGGAMAAAAASRRTASVYTCYVDASDAWDALQINYPSDGSAVLDAGDVAGLPGVESVERALFEYADLGPGTAYYVSVDEGGVAAIPQRLIAGRPVDPDATNEAVIAYALAEREGLAVGDSFQLVDPAILDELDNPEDRAFVENLLARVPEARINIVGVAAAPGWFPPLVSFGQPLMQFSGGFADADASAGENTVLFIRLADGADVTGFEQAMNALAADQGRASVLLHRDIARDVGRSLRPQVVALAALAGVLTVAGLVITAQAISRHVDADATDRLALDAVGLTARDQARAAAAQWFAVGAAAGVIGIALATALSPLSPTGLARLAEPDRGLSVDIPVLGLGLAVCVVACVGAGTLLTLRRLHGRTATSGGAGCVWGRAPWSVPGFEWPSSVEARPTACRCGRRSPASASRWPRPSRPSRSARPSTVNSTTRTATACAGTSR